MLDSARAVADEDEAIRLGAEQTGDRAGRRPGGRQPGDWKRAATLLSTLARNPDLPIPTRYLQAVACLKAGDAAGYRAACAGMAERLPRGEPKMSHHESNSAARAATLGPNATNDWTKTLAWTEHALTRLAEIEKARPDLKDLIRTGTAQVSEVRAGRSSTGPAGSRKRPRVLQQAMSVRSDGGELPRVRCSLPSPKPGSATPARRTRPRSRHGRPSGKRKPARSGKLPRSRCWPTNWTLRCRPRVSEAWYA